MTPPWIAIPAQCSYPTCMPHSMPLIPQLETLKVRRILPSNVLSILRTGHAAPKRTGSIPITVINGRRKNSLRNYLPRTMPAPSAPSSAESAYLSGTTFSRSPGATSTCMPMCPPLKTIFGMSRALISTTVGKSFFIPIGEHPP